jgi:hypothetical protein
MKPICKLQRKQIVLNMPRDVDAAAASDLFHILLSSDSHFPGLNAAKLLKLYIFGRFSKEV